MNMHFLCERVDSLSVLSIYMHTLTTLVPALSLPFMSNPIRTAVVPDVEGVGFSILSRID